MGGGCGKGLCVCLWQGSGAVCGCVWLGHGVGRVRVCVVGEWVRCVCGEGVGVCVWQWSGPRGVCVCKGAQANHNLPLSFLDNP